MNPNLLAASFPVAESTSGVPVMVPQSAYSANDLLSDALNLLNPDQPAYVVDPDTGRRFPLITGVAPIPSKVAASGPDASASKVLDLLRLGSKNPNQLAATIDALSAKNPELAGRLLRAVQMQQRGAAAQSGFAASGLSPLEEAQLGKNVVEATRAAVNPPITIGAPAAPSMAERISSAVAPAAGAAGRVAGTVGKKVGVPLGLAAGIGGLLGGGGYVINNYDDLFRGGSPASPAPGSVPAAPASPSGEVFPYGSNSPSAPQNGTPASPSAPGASIPTPSGSVRSGSAGSYTGTGYAPSTRSGSPDGNFDVSGYMTTDKNGNVVPTPEAIQETKDVRDKVQADLDAGKQPDNAWLNETFIGKLAGLMGVSPLVLLALAGVTGFIASKDGTMHFGDRLAGAVTGLSTALTPFKDPRLDSAKARADLKKSEAETNKENAMARFYDTSGRNDTEEVGIKRDNALREAQQFNLTYRLEYDKLKVALLNSSVPDLNDAKRRIETLNEVGVSIGNNLLTELGVPAAVVSQMKTPYDVYRKATEIASKNPAIAKDERYQQIMSIYTMWDQNQSMLTRTPTTPAASNLTYPGSGRTPGAALYGR